MSLINAMSVALIILTLSAVLVLYLGTRPAEADTAPYLLISETR